MKYVLLLISISLLSFLAVSPSAYAESGETVPSSSINNPGPESRALMFGLGSNFNLNSFRGGVFSYKWFTSNNRAHRFTTDLGFLYMTTDDTRRSTNEVSFESDNFEADIRFNYDFLSYNQVSRTVYSYWGIGPTLRFQYTDVERTETTSAGGSSFSNRYEETKYEVGLGASLTIGAEWFVHSGISISAEYALNISYNIANLDGKRTTGITQVNPGTIIEDERSASSINLDGSGARVGISVYF
ncbi:MAG: hypothetical protein LAT84_12675 [Balneolia bacterium]|nr:hypothetical protein [Balneolia bacterium]